MNNLQNIVGYTKDDKKMNNENLKEFKQSINEILTANLYKLSLMLIGVFSLLIALVHFAQALNWTQAEIGLAAIGLSFTILILTYINK